jgi:hypothetical protein
MYSAFLFLLLVFFSLFNCILSVLIASKMKREPKTSFWVHLWLQNEHFSELGNRTSISLFVVVLVTILTPHDERLRILSWHVYTSTLMVTDILSSTGSISVPEQLVHPDLNLWCTWSHFLYMLEVRHRSLMKHFKNINVGSNHCFMPIRIQILGLIQDFNNFIFI